MERVGEERQSREKKKRRDRASTKINILPIMDILIFYARKGEG